MVLLDKYQHYLISVSAGILVTKSSSEKNFGNLLGQQLTSVPVTIGMAGAVLLVLGFLPGLPKLSFFTLGAVH